MNLPQLRDNLDSDPFYKSLHPSEEVLVKCTSFSNIVKGVYYYGLKRWHIDGISGDWEPEVTEWWPMPEIGTGEKV